jgi:hypothetical protein
MEKEITALEPRLDAIALGLGATREGDQSSDWERTYKLWGLELMLKPEPRDRLGIYLCCPFNSNEHWRSAAGEHPTSMTVSLDKEDDKIGKEIVRKLAPSAQAILPELKRRIGLANALEARRDHRMNAATAAGAKPHRWDGSDKVNSVSTYGEVSYLNAKRDDDRVEIKAETSEQLALLVSITQLWNLGKTVKLTVE